MTLRWQDFVKRPEIKQLIESKGMEAARVRFMQEQNKISWYDPIILNEYKNAGQSVAANSSPAGKSTPFLIGHVSEVSNFQWASGLTNSITGAQHPASASISGFYFDIYAYNGTVDYTYNHAQSTKKFRFYIASGSSFTISDTNGINGVVTASFNYAETSNITGSLLHRWHSAIANQTATAVVAGFTNTIAPSTLFTSTLAAGSQSLSITAVNEGGVPDINTTFTSATASVSVTTNGTDKFYDPSGYYRDNRIIDGAIAPYNALPRKG
jgi:hypothetical protein